MPDFELARTPKGWQLWVPPLVYEAESPHLDRGVIRAVLSVRIHQDDGMALLYCDRVNLTSQQSRQRVVKALAEKRYDVDDRPLLALHEACHKYPLRREGEGDGGGEFSETPPAADLEGLLTTFKRWWTTRAFTRYRTCRRGPSRPDSTPHRVIRPCSRDSRTRCWCSRTSPRFSRSPTRKWLPSSPSSGKSTMASSTEPGEPAASCTGAADSVSWPASLPSSTSTTLRCRCSASASSCSVRPCPIARKWRPRRSSALARRPPCAANSRRSCMDSWRRAAMRGRASRLARPECWLP